MSINRKQIASAVVAVAILAGATVWAVASFSGTGGDETTKSQGCHSENDGHGHGKPADAAKNDCGKDDGCSDEHAKPKVPAKEDCGKEDGCIGEHGKPVSRPAGGCTENDGCESDPATKPAADIHEDNHDAHSDDDGHDHASHGAAAVDPTEFEKKFCEHKIRTVDCDECRYELGVVKVDASVTKALTKTTAVQETAAGSTLRLTGEVQHDQTRLVDVLPPAAGRVVAVKAQLGQRVQQGDVLAVLHSGDFGEAKAVYLETLAAAEVAQQEKLRQVGLSTSLEKLLAAAKERPDPELPTEAIGEWKSKLVNAIARLRQAKVVLEREQKLVAKQASSQAELENAQRELQTAQADCLAMLEEIQLNVKLDRLKAESAAKLAEAKLNVAEQRLHLLGLDDAALKTLPQAKENGSFAQLQVKAPRAGVITAQSITEGKFVESSQPMFTIADPTNVWVWCDVYDRDLGPLQERLAKSNHVQAMVKVAASDASFAGSVDLLGSEVNETTRTVKVRVQVKNDDGRLRPGMFASVEVLLAGDKKVALVPRQAVLNDEGRTFAFVHWKNDYWLRKDVKVGNTRGEMVEILSGLTAGEQVVSGGGFMFKSDVLRSKMGAGCAD